MLKSRENNLQAEEQHRPVRDQLPDLSPEELEELQQQEQKSSTSRLYWRTLRRKAWLIAGLASLTTFAGWLWSSLDKYTYTGNFYLLVEPITSASKLTNPTTIARTEGNPREDLFALDYPTNLAFLQSPGMTLKIAQDIEEKGETDKTVPAIWKDLRDKFRVERVSLSQNRGETKIFAVIYEGNDPDEVQSILEIAADTFLKYSAEDRQTSIKAGVEFIDEQIPDLQQRLSSLKSEQQKLRQQHQLLDPTTQGQEMFAQANQLSLKQLDIESQLKAQKTLYNLLNQQLQLQNPEEALAAASLSENPQRQALLVKLQEIESQIAVSSATFTANSPQLQDLQEQRQNIQKLLDRETQQILANNSLSPTQDSPVLNFQDSTRLNLIGQLVATANQIEMLEVQKQALAASQKKTKQEAKDFPRIIREYNDLERKIALNQEILDKLQVQRETLKVEASQDLPWQLISQPQIPLNADGTPQGEPPSRNKKIVAGALGGLILGAGLAIFLEKRRNIFYQPEDIKDTVSLPVVGEIPQENQEPLLPHLTSELKSPDEEEEIHSSLQEESAVFNALASSPSSEFIDAFDTLYSDLSLLYNDPPLRSLFISSVEAGDGQSTVALQLGIAAATTGQRVLLVDANWFNPQLHTRLNLPNYKGLANLLRDRVPFTEIVQRVPQFANLDLLSAGSAAIDSATRLWSPQMQSLMAEVQEKYDLVIYDPPHFFEAPDLSLMAAHSDGILMVVGIKKTPQSLVKQAAEKIKLLRLPIIGMVANHPL